MDHERWPEQHDRMLADHDRMIAESREAYERMQAAHERMREAQERMQERMQESQERMQEAHERIQKAQERAEREIAATRQLLRRAIRDGARAIAEIDDAITKLAAAQLITEEKLQRLIERDERRYGGNGSPGKGDS